MYGSYWLLIICVRWSWRDAYDHLDVDHRVSLFPEPLCHRHTELCIMYYSIPMGNCFCGDWIVISLNNVSAVLHRVEHGSLVEYDEYGVLLRRDYVRSSDHSEWVPFIRSLQSRGGVHARHMHPVWSWTVLWWSCVWAIEFMISIVVSLRVDWVLLYICAMRGHWDLRWSCSLTILFASCYRQCALCKSGVVGRQLTDVEHMCESGLEVPSRVNALMSSSQLCFVAIHFHR